MQKARLVLEDANTASQQPPVIPLAGVAHTRMVGHLTTQQQTHIHATPSGTHQRPTNAPGRRKIGCSQPDPMFRPGNTGQQRLNHFPVSTPISERYPRQAISLRWMWRHAHSTQTRRLPAVVPLGDPPLALEQFYPVSHHRATYFQHLFVPEAVTLRTGDTEIIGK